MMLKSRLKNFPILFWLGLTSFSIWLFSMRSVYSVDGTALYLYGFPAPWLRWSQVSSLVYIINFPNLLLSWGLYGLVFATIITTSSKFLTSVPNPIKIFGQALGVVLILLTAGCFYAYSSYFNFDLTFLDSSWTFHSREIYFSLERPYEPAN